jgi:hypothetical protein
LVLRGTRNEGEFDGLIGTPLLLVLYTHVDLPSDDGLLHPVGVVFIPVLYGEHPPTEEVPENVPIG